MNSMEKFFHSLLVYLQPAVFDYLAFPILHEKTYGRRRRLIFFQSVDMSLHFHKPRNSAGGAAFQKEKNEGFLIKPEAFVFYTISENPVSDRPALILMQNGGYPFIQKQCKG